MPKGTRVAKCVKDVMKKGKEKPNAIRICQSATGQAYATGRKPKRKKK